ncbi:MAG: chlorite dismutase family protein [Pseudomonadota bacterium]
MKNHYSFVGGDFVGDSKGRWRVISNTAIAGEPLPAISKLDMLNVPAATLTERGSWVLQGFTSNVRYAERRELVKLQAIQEGLNRKQALSGAMIPIKKSAAWWTLSQDERRAIFEEQSRHTEIGLHYLPAVARQLHHSRDLGEPFDFITWFEFAPEYTADFDKMLAQLRATKEWSYVEREVDIRLERDD